MLANRRNSASLVGPKVPEDVAEGVEAVGQASSIGVGGIALPSRVLSPSQRLRSSPSVAAVIALVVFTLFGVTQTSLFVDGQTWVIILRDASYTAIVSCFEGLVMISGGLDLSVGSTFLAGAMVAGALSQGQGAVLPLLGVVGIGAGIGSVNGILISYFGLSSIIVTLGMMFAISSVILTVTGGLAITIPSGFAHIGEASWGPIPVVVFYALVVAVGAHLLLEYTPFGIRIRAAGGNKEAARALGLNPRNTSMIVYVLCGVFASLAGMLQATNLAAANTTYGSDLELQAIAAVVIGGTSIYGAVGSMPGAVLGALLLSVLSTGLIILHVNGEMQDFAIGVVIVLAVGFDRLRKLRRFRTSVGGNGASGLGRGATEAPAGWVPE